ncbi:MAG: hypothetical protein U9Q83_06140 [Bacteroidota bacterium]|nr:hypothetical protein [Bacteroidota bacterium]
MRKTLFFLIMSVVFVFGSCKCNSKNNSNNDEKDSSFVAKLPSIVKIEDKLFNVPSPLQASEFIKNQNIVFDIDLLNSPDNYSKYLTTFKQALNLGVYGADLGNLFINEQLSKSSEYFNVIKKLSEQVGILSVLDQNLVDRIDANTNNKDSLIFLTSGVFRDIDNYLLKNAQKDVGVLIITGGWIESFYYLLKIAVKNDNPEIISKIGEQKNPLNNIINLLQPYYNQKSDDFDILHEELVNLSIIFDSIEENYIYEDTETDANKKITIIHSTTTYNVSENILAELDKSVERIRNWIIE